MLFGEQARFVSSRQRIGIFGGTFDPVHNAHCAIARAALHEAKLDRVFFVVAGQPPHKTADVLASPEERFAMVQAAIADEPAMGVSRVELERTGLSYTVDTVNAFARDYPDAELLLIIGYDSLVDFMKWKDPAGILKRARLLAVPRPGLLQAVPAALEAHYDLLPFAETNLSSTEVRDLIVSGAAFGHLVPPAVERLILERGIYAHHASASR